MKKFLLKLIIIFLSIFILTSCIEKNSSSTERKSNDVFVMTTDYFPKDLISDGFELSYMLFDGLVKYDINGNIISSLSKSWDVLNRGLKYRFTLKDNLLLSNGKSIDSKYIKDFFISFLESDLIDIEYKNMLEPIFGVKEFLDTGDKSNIAINIINDKIIEFNLNNRCSYFLQLLSNPIFFIKDIELCTDNWINNYSEIAYSGPYKIENINQNKITLTKNDNYSGRYALNKKEVIYERMISENAMAKFDLNNVDAMLDVPKSELKRLNDDQYLNETSTEIVYTLNFNLRNEDVKNINFRKKIIEGIEKAKDEDFTFENLNYNTSFFKEDRTNALPASLDMLLKDTNDSNTFIEFLKKILKSQFNIDLNIKYFDDYKDLLDSNYHIALLEISPDFLDEMSLLENWRSDSKQNYFAFSDDKFDKSLNRATESSDNVEQIKTCQDILKSDYVTTILGYESKAVCIKNQNNNLFLDRMGILRFDL